MKDKQILGWMVCGLSCVVMILLYVIDQQRIQLDTLKIPVNSVYGMNVYGMNVDCIDGMSGVYIHAVDSGWSIETEKPVQCNISFTL